jgi:hypothetical protein
VPRPRLSPHGERPICLVADHVGDYVWFDGTYSTNQAHARTHFKSTPRATQDHAWKKHPFYVPTSRARRFIYSAREAAKVLKSVPYGGNYREINHDVRRHAHRGVEDDHGRLVTSANGSLAADYLDRYADLVMTTSRRPSGPRSSRFRVRAWADGQTVRRGKPKASILGAFGYPEVGKKGRVCLHPWPTQRSCPTRSPPDLSLARGPT